MNIVGNKNLLCLCIDVSHYKMKCSLMLLLNMVQCVDVAKVYVQIGIRWKLCDLLLSSMPLVDCCIQLAQIYSVGWAQYGSGLTAVATRATMGTGTSYFISPSVLPSCVGNRYWKRLVKDGVALVAVKYMLQIIVMICLFWYGRKHITSAFTAPGWHRQTVRGQLVETVWLTFSVPRKV